MGMNGDAPDPGYAMKGPRWGYPPHPSGLSQEGRQHGDEWGCPRPRLRYEGYPIFNCRGATR